MNCVVYFIFYGPPDHFESGVFRLNIKIDAYMRAMGIYSDALNGFSHPINRIPVDDWIVSFFM